MKGFRFPPLLLAILILVAAYGIFKYAVPPVLPMSLMIPYMFICTIGVLLFFSYDDESWQRFKAPIIAVLQQDNTWPIRWLLLLLIPAAIGYSSFILIQPDWQAPAESRQVHPAPPSTLAVYNRSYELDSLENPVRLEVVASMQAGDKDKAWQIYHEAVAAGRDIYYQNCYFCHGDLMYGEGVFADGFNPRPINFQDNTINQLQEAYLFWRTATGGPGLPREGAPWNSSMPAWHESLDEQAIWNVITFMYDYVGEVPRIWDPELSRIVTAMSAELEAKRAKMRGRELYDLRCSVCHGEQGAGDGIAADSQYPRPRDFTLGLFKYKTSPGTLPARDEDLFNSIKYGLNGTAMPGWSKILTDEQIRSLIPVLKGFDISATWAPEDAADEDFDDEGRYLKQDFISVSELEPMTGQVAYSETSVARGKAAYEPCQECHGLDGRGNIRSGKQLADDWGYRLWPRDLTKLWTWAVINPGADTDPIKLRDAIIRNIYLRISIGIPGTPMPAHRTEEADNEDPISLEDRWHIANYIYSMSSQNTTSGNPVIQAGRVGGKLPVSVTDKAWNRAPVTAMRLVPNLIKDPRLFTPLNDMISVRALYNDEDIAFLLTINDRTESLPGHEYSMIIQDEALSLYSDAVAMQFPKDQAYSSVAAVEKPLLQHGDITHPVSLWYWHAGSVEPKQSARTMVFHGSGQAQHAQPVDGNTGVSAHGQWQEGQWQIIMKRQRQGTGNEISFNEGKFIPVAFANWDGSNGETGSKHTLTAWFWILLPPEIDPLKLYGLPAALALLIMLLLLLLVQGQRKKYRQGR